MRMGRARLSEEMEPAASIIEKFGGKKQIADIAGCSLFATYNWVRPRAERGADGLIPSRYWPALLDYAHRHGIRLKAEDFLRLRKRGKVA